MFEKHVESIKGMVNIDAAALAAKMVMRVVERSEASPIQAFTQVGVSTRYCSTAVCSLCSPAGKASTVLGLRICRFNEPIGLRIVEVFVCFKPLGVLIEYWLPSVADIS